METWLAAFSAWGHRGPWSWRVLSSLPCVWILAFLLGFTSLNRWFRCFCTTEGSASPSFPSLLTHRSFRIESWNSRAWGAGSVCSGTGQDLFIPVWVLGVSCASPCSHTAKISSSCKFCDFFYFILVFGPQEILILNPFSNIKFLVKVKKKSHTPLFWYSIGLCGINIDSRMRRRSQVHLRTLGQQMGIESVSVHLKYTKLVTVWKKGLFHDFYLEKHLLWLACPDGNRLA